MKNIIVGPAFPLRGGIANFNESLCTAFNKKGIQSEIISFSLQYPGFLFPGKTQLDTSGKPPENCRITSMINSINPVSWFKAARYINRQQPDFVIIRYWLPFMGPCLGTIARMINKNIKIIAITDNVIPHEKRPGDSMFTRYFLKACDGFVAMSRSVLNDIKRFTTNPNKKFLPHPVYDIFGNAVGKNEALQYLKLDEKYHYLLFFGFIRRYKGLDLLLQAMADNRLKKLPVKLIIAGEYYEDSEFYEGIIKKYNLHEKIVLHTRFIPLKEVKYYFCASDMVAQTYHTATQSGVTQIAYNFDRPMLVTDVGGLAETVPHQKAGYVCRKDPGQIAEAIEDFFINEREASFVEQVKEEKKKYSWDAMVHGILELESELGG